MLRGFGKDFGVLTSRTVRAAVNDQHFVVVNPHRREIAHSFLPFLGEGEGFGLPNVAHGSGPCDRRLPSCFTTLRRRGRSREGLFGFSAYRLFGISAFRLVVLFVFATFPVSIASAFKRCPTRRSWTMKDPSDFLSFVDASTAPADTVAAALGSAVGKVGGGQVVRLWALTWPWCLAALSFAFGALFAGAFNLERPCCWGRRSRGRGSSSRNSSVQGSSGYCSHRKHWGRLFFWGMDCSSTTASPACRGTDLTTQPTTESDDEEETGWRPRKNTEAIEGELTEGQSMEGKKRVRVFMDGCFDMMHYGHANALRQARALGDELVVGVVSDEEIRANKGPPVFSMGERVRMVSSVKWVDGVIEGTPYCIDATFLNTLFTHHGVDVIVHGDDPCLLPDGTDAYAEAKRAGRYREIKRTEGISSTDIVGRMLQFSRHQQQQDQKQQWQWQQQQQQLQVQEEEQQHTEPQGASCSHEDRERKKMNEENVCTQSRKKQDREAGDFLVCCGSRRLSSSSSSSSSLSSSSSSLASSSVSFSVSPSSSTFLLGVLPSPLLSSAPVFLPTSRRIVQFAGLPDGCQERARRSQAEVSPLRTVVYIDGAFDVLHPGHVEILRDARSLGDYLIVGVHDDAVVRACRGPHHPLLSLHERCLSLLACRYVDDVIFGAPWVITKDLISTFNIAIVVHGTIAEPNPLVHDEAVDARLAVPVEMGVLRVLYSRSQTTTSSIVHRVLANRQLYEARNSVRLRKEKEYYEGKRYIVEQ